MKRIIIFILLCLVAFVPNVDAEDKVDVYLFHSKYCTHCQAEMEYLNSLDNIELHAYEVMEVEENALLMTKVKEALNITNRQVPFTIIGNTYFIGYSSGTQKAISHLIDKEVEVKSVDVISKILNDEDVSDIKMVEGTIDSIEIFGYYIDLTEISIPLVAALIGFIDGFNPCAMWVLLFLITMIIGMKNRRKMWTIGLTFLITSALVYLAIMAAWLKVAVTLTQVSWIRLALALVALVVGTINLINYYEERKQDDGCHVVDNKRRKSILSKIRDIVAKATTDESSFLKSELSFALALIGVVGLAISVNLIELACSSGLPLIFTQVLALNDLTTAQYAFYMGLYILFFLIDDIVVFTIAMKTLKVTCISTKYNKLSHLIGGIVMILIGLLMVFKPGWLMFSF